MMPSSSSLLGCSDLGAFKISPTSSADVRVRDSVSVRHAQRTFFRRALALKLDVMPVDPGQELVAMKRLKQGVVIVVIIVIAVIFTQALRGMSMVMRIIEKPRYSP